MSPTLSDSVLLSLSALCWVLVHVGWGRPSNCPCWVLRWWCWRREKGSPGTMFSTCGPSPYATSVGSEPKSSMANSALALWITSVSNYYYYNYYWRVVWGIICINLTGLREPLGSHHGINKGFWNLSGCRVWCRCINLELLDKKVSMLFQSKNVMTEARDSLNYK